MSITFSPSENMEHDGINMANGNAYAIMSLLKMEPECCGRISTEELIEKINAVTSTAPIVKESTIDAQPGCATIIDCGRTHEYVVGRLWELRCMAINNPGYISWG